GKKVVDEAALDRMSLKIGLHPLTLCVEALRNQITILSAVHQTPLQIQIRRGYFSKNAPSPTLALLRR
ncbi:hypothetical protein ACQR1I_36565, partial [Bradyrhizobium sp. HKCCYLS2038]|uniref:hypothetical protein n=1 Tax=unclassified Bradyrhizobium TaxID=2631580 RepID=UPI003EB99B02